MKIIKGILSTTIVFLLSFCMITQLCVSAVTKNYPDSELKDKLYIEICTAEESNAPGDNYTNESVSVLQEAIKKAEEVYNDQNATETDIQNAIDSLKSAVEGLTKPDIDTKELWKLIEESKYYTARGNKYTQTSYNEFSAAYSDACAAYYYGQTQEQVDRAKDALASALENLEIKYAGIMGDVNGDNAISIIDATLIQEYLSNFVDFDDLQKISADFNDDGLVNVADATCIQKKLVNMD